MKSSEHVVAQLLSDYVLRQGAILARLRSLTRPAKIFIGVNWMARRYDVFHIPQTVDGLTSVGKDGAKTLFFLRDMQEARWLLVMGYFCGMTSSYVGRGLSF